jgi:hypothetical protein
MSKEPIAQSPKEVDELEEARKRVRELEDRQRPVVEMLRFDIWRGDLVVLKQKMNRLTGQSYVTKMQFQITGKKPSKSVSVTQKQADFWNETHWTARAQSTDLLFPAGVKYDIYWDFDEENETWTKTEKELETA